jgi:hypothetical protein
MNEEFDQFEEHMVNEELEPYEMFVKRMEEKYPEMFSQPYGGFAIGKGWWPIIESLCGQISSYTKWKNNTREALLKDNPNNFDIPDAVPQVTVAQIKEKFGGLRFYYDGGNEHISGMVRMAEIWADKSCETCGAPGTSGGKGWIKTLCPTHRTEADARYTERFKS